MNFLRQQSTFQDKEVCLVCCGRDIQVASSGCTVDRRTNQVWGEKGRLHMSALKKKLNRQLGEIQFQFEHGEKA